MPILYDKLFALIKAQGKTEYYLRKNGISPSILDKLKHQKGGLDARTIEKLCALLNCQPGDIMEYIPPTEGVVCASCDRRFTYCITNGGYPGGKDREYIYCPWCNAENGSEVTSGTISTQKIE